MSSISTTHSSSLASNFFCSTGSLLLLTVLLTLLPSPARSQTAAPAIAEPHEYSALWRQKDAYVEPRTDMTAYTLQTTMTELATMQLFDLETRVEDGVRLYTGLWRDTTVLVIGDLYHVESGAAPALPAALDPNAGAGCDPFTGAGCASGASGLDFATEVAIQRALGFELVDFELDSNRTEIFGVFHPGTATHELELDIAFSDAQNRVAQQAALGWVPVDVETYKIGANDYLALLWRYDSSAQMKLEWGNSYQNFGATAQKQWSSGYRLYDIEQFWVPQQVPSDPVDGYISFVGIWEVAQDEDYLATEIEWSDLLALDAQITLEQLELSPTAIPSQLFDVDSAMNGGHGNETQGLGHTGPLGQDPLGGEDDEEEDSGQENNSGN